MKLRGKTVPAWILLAVIIAAAVVGTSVAVYVIVTQPDFGLSTVSDPMILINGTSSGQRAIGVGPVNGYTGIVTVTLSPPAGFKGRLGISSPTGTYLGPQQVQVLLGSAENVTLGVDSFLAGNYSFVVTGVSGKLSHSVTVNVVVRGLFLSANPNPAPLPPSGSYTTTSQVSVTSLNGLSGNFTVGYTNNNSFYPLSGTGPAYVVVGLGQTVKFNVTIDTQRSPGGGGLYVDIGTPLGDTSYLLTVQ